jgi:hypothetical protein
MAGRGTQIDAPVPGSTAACTVGSTCSNFVDISASGLFNSAYIYQEGIVSIDAALPTNFNIADPSTYNGVIFFTPGYSAGKTYFVSAYLDNGSSSPTGAPPSWGFNFFTSEQVQQDSGFPNMQVQLGTSDPSQDPNAAWVGATAALGYLAGFQPPADAYIGFSWGSAALTQLVQNNNGLLVGPAPTDTDFVSTATVNAEGDVTSATRFTPLYADGQTGGVPEPATWAMMLMGFGLVGFALRREARVSVSLS